jgi:hypothetical protein
MKKYAEMYFGALNMIMMINMSTGKQIPFNQTGSIGLT